MTETDQPKPYTNADIETVGTAIRECGMKDAFFDSSSGSWEVEEKQYQYDMAARVVLDALTAAGWRPPTGTVGRCGHQMPGPILAYGRTAPISCRLPAGHAGWHRSGVTEWGRRPTPHLDTVKAERDEARRIADSLRQDLSDAGDVIAAVREAAERLDRALTGRLPSLPDVRSAVEHINRALATYDTPARSTEPDWSHEIAFDADGTWAISHPDGCPGQAFGDCDVQRLATEQAARYQTLGVAGLRFQCAVNDLRDRFLVGDRIDAGADQ